MRQVSEDIKNAIKSDKYDCRFFIVLDKEKISEDIAEVKLTSILGEKLIGNIMTSEINFKLFNASRYKLTDKEIEFIIQINDEEINFGKFKVLEPETKDKNSDEINVRAISEGLILDKKELVIEGNKTLEQIAKEKTLFIDDFITKDFLVKNASKFDNISEFYQTLSSALGGNLDLDNKIIKKLSKTAVIELTDLFDLKESGYELKGVNCIVLSRIDNGDGKSTEDVIKKLDNVTEENLSEFKIIGNQFLDDDREAGASLLLNELKGLNYKGCEFEIPLNPILELADYVTVKTLNPFNCYITEIEHDFNNLTTTIKSSIMTKSQTDHKSATNKDKLKRVEIKVDKFNSKIESITEVVDENTSKVIKAIQDIEKLSYDFTNIGGLNLIKNSLLLKTTDDKYDFWNIEDKSEDNFLTIQGSNNSLTKGGESGVIVSFKNKKLSQNLTVKADLPSLLEKDKTYYTLNFRVQKDSVSKLIVRLFNELEEHKLEITEEADFKEYEIKAILPKKENFTIELDAEENVTITDLMFSSGKEKIKWNQASGETMNGNVQINENGLKVKNSKFIGDHTEITPLGLGGYSNISGKTEKVFGLDRDKTFSTKLEAKEEFTLKPAKIVPIRTGEVQGIAFVEVVK